MPLVVYTYSNCDTCRRATKWLRARGLPFTEKPIRETPPSLAELRQMLDFHHGEIRRLFNTAGQEYRALGLKDKLPAMAADTAIGLLSRNGSLVKRPFLLGKSVGLVGFDEVVWGEAILPK